MLKLSKFSSLSKQLRQKNVKKKGTGWFFGDISNQRDLVQTFFPIKENVASEMEYSLAWISNPDVESCQIATETIKIEKMIKVWLKSVQSLWQKDKTTEVPQT